MKSILLAFKRFLFIAAISPKKEFATGSQISREELAPSPLIDQMWKLHISNKEINEKINSEVFNG